MEDDELCCDVKPWSQRGDYKSAFAINLTEPLFTIKDSLHQSVLRTLKFPEVVAAKTMSVDGPVRVDNVDQHVRIRSEIIIPTQSIISNVEDGQQQGCPEDGRRLCRDPVGSTRSDGSSDDDECDDDDEDDDDDEQEDDDDEEEEDDVETQDDSDEDDDDDYEDISAKPCSNTRPCRDPPKGVQMPQAPGKTPTQMPIRPCRDKATTEKASTENETTAESELTKTQEEVTKEKERTPEEEEELNGLHEQCLHLSKEELEAICNKYKNYDKRFKIKRTKSDQTGTCKYKINKQKQGKESVGEKQQDEDKTEEGDYFCQETIKDNINVDAEEDEECEDGEEKEKANKETEVNEKEADDCDDEEYEEEDEAEQYYGLERPCKAAPIVCEKPTKDKETEPEQVCVPRDYSRYDKQRNEEKEKDIFYKLSPKFSAKEKKPKNSKTVCDDGKKHGNKLRGLAKDDKSTELSNNKLADQQDTIYYECKMKQEKTANKKNKKEAKEDTEKKQISTDEVYFTGKRNEPQTAAKTEEIKPKLCNNEYYTSDIDNSNNNNNNSDECEEDGGYFESSDDLIKDDDGDSRSEFTGSNGGFAYSCSHVDEVEDNTNESCGVGTVVAQHRQYPDAHNQLHNGRMSDNTQSLVSYFCPEISRNQHKYQAYGHSGDDDADGSYFTSAVLPSGEDARRNKNRRVKAAIFTDTERNYFTSGVERTSRAFSVDGLAISSFEPLATDVVSMSSDHFEHCKRVFESMKQRAFGDDFEDYFESCLSSSLEDNLEMNVPSSATTPPVAQILPAPVPQSKTVAVVDEECAAKRNGFLKSLFGIIGKTASKQNRKSGKATPDCVADAGDVYRIAKAKGIEKRFFTFGRYKEKNGDKVSNKSQVSVKKPKESSDSLSGKAEKRKFRFGKTMNEKRQKKVDTAGVIESFLAIEKTANQYYAADDNFEIKNNGYIFKCGKLIKRLHTGDAAEMGSERRRTCFERQESGDTQGKLVAGESFSEKTAQATTAAGDCHQSNERYWEQVQDHPEEIYDVKSTPHAETQDGNTVEELVNEPEASTPHESEVSTPHELAVDVVSRNSQTELLNKISSVGSIRGAALMHSASETNESVGMVDSQEGTRKVYSAPDTSSASVQIIVSDNMSNVDVLTTALCGYSVLPSENKATNVRQPKHKVSSFMVVSRAAEKNAQNATKPNGQVIRRKIIEQEAVIISRHDKKCKESKSPAKSQNIKEMRPEPSEAYRPRERRPEINYEKHIHESKSLNRTVFGDSYTVGHAHRPEDRPSFHSYSTTSPREKLHYLSLTRTEQKATKKYPEMKSSRRNKSANCVINNRPGIAFTSVHYAKEDAFANLKTTMSPYIARRSMHSTRAKSDTRLQKPKPNKSSNVWLQKCDLSENRGAVKNSSRQKQFVNRSGQGDRKIPREIYSHRKASQLLNKVMYDGNHNVNCGADDEDDDEYDDDFGNCQPQTVNNIIFSDKQQPVQHVRNRIDVVSREANQAFVSNSGVGCTVVPDKFTPNETSVANAVSRQHVQFETGATGPGDAKVTGRNTRETEMSADKINKEHIQMPTTEELSVNDALNTRGQLTTEAVNLESNASSSETINAEATNFLLSVGDNINGNILETLLNEKGQQQKLYNGELGMVQDCSGTNWEIEPSLCDDYLIVNSKNENVIYHFQSENRPIWKSGDYDDIETSVHEAQDEIINKGRYTKYDAIDDGRDGAIFDENQLMRCSNVGNDRRQQSKEYGLYNGMKCQDAGDYADVTSSGDKFAGWRLRREPTQESPVYHYTQVSSVQKKDSNFWTTLDDQETNKQTGISNSHCGSCVGKTWRFADALLKNTGEEAKYGDLWVDGTYTSQWRDGGEWQTAIASSENQREDGKEREFWGDYIHSTVGNFGKTKTPTAVNILSDLEERKNTEFWNTAIYTATNKCEKAYVNAGGHPGEVKNIEFRSSTLYSLANNASDKIQQINEEVSEHPRDEFWSDKLYSPTRKGKRNWKAGEGSDDKKSDELNAFLESQTNTDGNVTKGVPVKNERRSYISPEKFVEGSMIESNEAETKAETDRRITRQYASPTLQKRKFIHLPESYTKKALLSNSPSISPEVIVPTKECSPEIAEMEVSIPEPCRELPCLKEKPITIYDICKPTVITLKTPIASDIAKPTEIKEKRNSVKETVKEKRNSTMERVKSSGNRKKEHQKHEANNVVTSKDTKKSESSRKSRNTGTSEAANKLPEAKVEQKITGKELAVRREKIGDWFNQEKVATSPKANARRSKKRDCEENNGRETPRFLGSGKQLVPCLLKPENREASVAKKDRESNVARETVNANVARKKTPFQSQSQETVNGDDVIFINPCGDGTRSKKWKLFVVSERKAIEGNTKPDTELEPTVQHKVSTSRESHERVLLGSNYLQSRQVAGKITERAVANQAGDDVSNRHTNGQSKANAKPFVSASHRTKQQPESKKETSNVTDKKSNDSKMMKGSPEQPKKHSRVYKIDIGEQLKLYDHKKPATLIKDHVNGMDEYGFGPLVQLTAYSRDKDTTKLKIALGKQEDNQHKIKPARVFKIDCEEKVSNKSRYRTKVNTAKKQKAEEILVTQCHLMEQQKRPVRVFDKEEKDRANKAFFDRYRHRNRHQQISETSDMKDDSVKVENSRSEMMSLQQSVDNNQSAFTEDLKKSNLPGKEECQKLKEEMHGRKYKSDNKNTNTRYRSSTHKLVDGYSDIEMTHSLGYPGYMWDSSQGDGFNYREAESQQTQGHFGESCVDMDSARQHIPPSFDVGRSESDRNRKASRAKIDSDTKKHMHRQSRENRRRQDAVKKSRTDTNQTDRFVPTLIDSSVVNTVARAWMDDTERLGINSLQEAKLFSPSVLLHQTSGSPTTNCHYINSPRDMINTTELTNQHNPLAFGGDYFDLFPRPTFLSATRYQETDSGEHDQKTTSDSEYATCKLCPTGYFETYTNDGDGSQQQQQQQQQQQADYSGDAHSSQDRDQKKGKNQELPKSSKPYYRSTEKASSGTAGVVSRSGFNRADKAADFRKHVSKDDSFINIGHSFNLVITETSVPKLGDKQINRQSRTAKAAEIPHSVGDQQTVKQAQERKNVDPKSIKKALENSKPIRKIESADDVRSVPENTKTVKPVLEISKTVKPVLEISKTVKPVLEISKVVNPGLEASKIVKPVPENAKTVIKSVLEISKTVQPVLEISKAVNPGLEISKAAAKPVFETSKTVKPAAENSKAVKPGLDISKAAKPVLETSKVVKPVSETSKTLKPAAENAKAVKPALENLRAVKSAMEPSKAVKSVLETSKTVRPVSETSKYVKSVSETSKSIKSLSGTSKTVKSALDTSKASKTAHEHSKAEHAYSYKPSHMDNSQSSKTTSDNQQGKGHMFSYKVSSKGNRPEVVKAEPKLLVQADSESPVGVVETVGTKLETVRQETTQEPAQMGLFARILNTLTRSTNNQLVTQSIKGDATGKVELNASGKTDSSERMNTQNAGGSASAPKETITGNLKNKPLRTRSPLLTRDAKTLRPEYKQNMNCNAFVKPSKPNLPTKHSCASFGKPLNKPTRQSIQGALTSGESCIASLTTALEWNAILLIVIFTLYLGTCCPGLLKPYLSCPLPCFWEILYKYGLISLGIDAFLISRAMTGPFALGSKNPKKGMFYSHFGAISASLVYAATLLYTYVNGPFVSALYHAMIKAITFLLFLIFYTCNSTLQFFSAVKTTHKFPRYGGASIGGRPSFYAASNQPKPECDFAFWESVYLKALNRYPAKCL